MQLCSRKRKHKHISIRLELPDYERIKAWAESEGRPIAAQARTYLLKKLDEHERGPQK